MATNEETISLIAIHGVGNHKKGDIASWVTENIAKEPLELKLDIQEFNWDAIVEHSRHQKRKKLYWYVQTASHNIFEMAYLGLGLSTSTLDAKLSSLQLNLVYFTHWLIAAAFTIFLSLPFLQLSVLTPSLLWNIPNKLSPFAEELILWGLDVFIYIIGIGLISVLAIGIVRSYKQRSRNPIAMATRCSGLLLVQPVLVLLSMPIILDLQAYFTVLFLYCMLLGVPLAFIYAFGTFPGAETITSTFHTEFYLVFLFATILIGVFRLALGNKWIDGPIKVVLDIARYLVEPDYRAKLLGELNSRIEDGRGFATNNQFILLAHSLGSVIAIDSLLHSDAWHPQDKVYIITMGSPFKRFFLHAFPDIIFPRSITEVGVNFKKRIKNLRWLNVYRPWDYIGTNLGLDKAGVGMDVSTEQYLRLVTAHSDYWRDPKALQTISNTYVSVPKNQGEHAARENCQPYFHEKMEAHPAWEVLYVGAAWLLVPAYAAAMFVWLYSAYSWQAGVLEAQFTKLYPNAIEVKSNVEEERVSVTTSSFEIPLLSVVRAKQEFLFDDPRFPDIKVNTLALGQNIKLQLDYRKLHDHIREKCTLLEDDTWWRLESNIDCKRDDVLIRYLRDNPQVLIFPCCMPKAYAVDLMLSFWTLVKGWVWIIAIAAPGLFLTIAIYKLFVGYSPSFQAVLSS